MKDHTFQIEIDGTAGDTLEIQCYRGEVRICIEEPWAGSTETGFGYECSAYLKREQLVAFRDAINEILEND